MNKETLIEKHLKGQLSAKERLQFQQWMDEDASFAHEVKFQENLVRAVQEDERIRLKAQLSQIRPSTQKKTIFGKSQGWLWFVLMALLVGLGILLGYQKRLQKQKPEVIFAANFSAYPNTFQPVTRNSGLTELGKAFQAYENQQYEVAIEGFSQLIQDTVRPALIYYRGISYLAIGEYDLGLRDLQNVSGTMSPYQTEALWYLSLTYLQRNDVNLAKEMLDDYLSQSSEKLFASQARDILEKLK